MKSILILGNCVAGLYKFRKEVIEALIKDGYCVYFSTPNNDSLSVENLKKMGAQFVETSIERRSCNLFKDIILFLKYMIMIKKIKPNMILGYTIKPNIYGSFAAQVLGVDYINNITGLGTVFQRDTFFSGILKQMYRYAFKNSKCIFFQNEENIHFFLKNKLIEGRKIKLIPGSGVNLKEFSPMSKTIEKPWPVFLFIGRIMKEKGIEEYLEAARMIKEDGYEAEFQILGSWEEDEWKKKVEEYEVKGYVKYLGFSDDVREEIRNCDCVVNPSYHEGMSNVLLEAGAMGKILLGSNISGIKEIICPLGSKYLFEKGNINDLKEKILSILMIQERTLLGREFKNKIILNFDRKLIVKTYLKLIKTESF